MKVQFHWDREGKQDDHSSCWIRVASPWAGQGWGMLSLPRVGQEVIVSFQEGDSDQLIITGRVYNALQVPPGHLPQSKTQMFLKSKTYILLLGDYSETGEVDWDKRKDILDYIYDNVDIFHAFSVPSSQGYACITLIDVLISIFCINTLGGHREFALPGDYRTCPGNIGMQFVNYLRKYFGLKAPENNHE